MTSPNSHSSVRAALGVTVDGTAVIQSGTTYRYTFAGTFTAGAVNVEFVAGSFEDLASNANLAETETFTVETTSSETDAPTADLADPIEGGSIDASDLNTRGYIDVTFADTGGSDLATASVTDAGAEFILSGTAAEGVIVAGAGTLVSGTTYRYAFTGSFTGGEVAVHFLAGSFRDVAGNLNGAESECFTVTVPDIFPPTADLADPVDGGTIELADLNSRGYIDVTFGDVGDGVDASTIDGNEVSISGAGVGTAVLDGTAVLQSGTTYRYAFTGDFVEGLVIVDFVAGSFSDVAGNFHAGDTESFTVALADMAPPTADLSDPIDGGAIELADLNLRDYIDVTFGDVGDGLDLASIDGDELAISGTGVGTAVLDGTAVLQSGTTYRYTFTGDFVVGTVTVDFLAGSFQDLAGNANASETESFTVTQADTTPPTADLSDPTDGGTIELADLNLRDYIDVTFSDLGDGLDLASIDGDELAIGGTGVGTAVLDGTAVLQSGTTYRYTFTGDFVVGTVTVDFLAGSFQDLAGNANAGETESFTVTMDDTVATDRRPV